MNEKLRAKLAERGVNPEQFMQKLSQYVGSQGQAFKTPQEYGQAIQQKKAAGQTLSDPETARIFESLTAPQRQTTTIPFPFGTFTPPKGVPGSNLMQAVLQHQQANPITIPYAPGTPTLATRQAEEAMRAQAAQEAFQREQFDWEKDMKERQFAADQAYRNAQLALSMLKSGGGGTGTQQARRDDQSYFRDLSARAGEPMIWDVNRPPESVIDQVTPKTAQEEIWDVMQYVVDTGGSWDNVVNAIRAKAPVLQKEKLSVEDALQWALDGYSLAIENKIKQLSPVRDFQEMSRLQRELRKAQNTVLPQADSEYTRIQQMVGY